MLSFRYISAMGVHFQNCRYILDSLNFGKIDDMLQICPYFVRFSMLDCHYMQFGQSACMFRISYGFQWRQYRRYIADIAIYHFFNKRYEIIAFWKKI